MKITKRYKNYAHLFFGYILIYHLFLIYAVLFADVPPELNETWSVNYLAFIFYLFIMLINKSKLYYRQIANENFGFFKGSDMLVWSTRSDRIFERLGFIKSLIGILFYFMYSFALFEIILGMPKEADTTTLLTVLKVGIYIFPLILLLWDFKRIRYYPLKKKEEIQMVRKEHLEYADKMEKYTHMQSKPDELGTMTGYEPRKLEEIELVSTPLMKGNPGAGLSGSSFSQSNINAGSLGELNFAKVLQKNDYLDKFATYWSVQYPFEYVPGPDTSMQADIDCILISQKNIYLIDLKLYSQGNITWQTTGDGKAIQAIDNVTGNWVGKPRKMSRNMYYATERIQSKIEMLGIDMKVRPYVVMMPTDRGQGKVDNVFWPRNVACLTLIDFLKTIEKDRAYNDQTADAELLDSIFKWLIKDESGSAPRYDV